MRARAIETLVKVPRLTPGRRRQALKRMRAVMASMPAVPGLDEAMDTAEALHSELARLVNEWRRVQDDVAMHTQTAGALDNQVDRLLSAFHNHLRDAADLHGADSPVAASAAVLLDRLFAGGVRQITALPYVDQHEAVAALIEQMQTEPAVTEAIATLGIEDVVGHLAGLNEAYGAALSKPQRMTYGELRDRDREAWMSVVAVVARIAGAFPSSSDEDGAARDALLGPLEAQAEEMSRLRARRAAGGLLDTPEETDIEDDADEGDDDFADLDDDVNVAPA